MVQAPNFNKFRNFFNGEFKKGFVVPANTFDNVNGHFPIGFFIWDLENKRSIDLVEFDIYDNTFNHLGSKIFPTYDNDIFIIEWLRKYYDKKSDRIA